MQIIVRKQARLLLALEDGGPELRYPITLGRNSAADKAVEGDEATPLGEFYICAKNPRSRFFLSMCISYPNAEHAARGLAANLITPDEHAAILEAIRRRALPPQHTRLGGEIYIHGEDPGRTRAAGASAGATARAIAGASAGTSARATAGAGTRGCIALENPAMQELYERTALGTTVIITP